MMCKEHQPIGTNLEIVDYDDDVTLADNQNTVEDASNIKDQPPAEMRCHPVWERRPLARHKILMMRISS